MQDERVVPVGNQTGALQGEPGVAECRDRSECSPPERRPEQVAVLVKKCGKGDCPQDLGDKGETQDRDPVRSAATGSLTRYGYNAATQPIAARIPKILPANGRRRSSSAAARQTRAATPAETNRQRGIAPVPTMVLARMNGAGVRAMSAPSTPTCANAERCKPFAAIYPARESCSPQLRLPFHLKQQRLKKTHAKGGIISPSSISRKPGINELFLPQPWGY